MNRRFLLVAPVLALATVALFLHWLSADPTEPRFQATSSPPRLRPGTLISYNFLTDRPFEGDRLWIHLIATDRRGSWVLFDLNQLRVLGELFNADPVFSGADPSILLCVNRSLPESPRRAAINRFIRRMTGGRIRLSIPEPDLETFWRLDLHRGTTTRLGSFKQDPGTGTLFAPSPGSRYGYNKPTTSFSKPQFYLCDLDQATLRRVDLDGWPAGWWSPTEILLKDAGASYFLYDVANGATNALLRAETITAFLEHSGVGAVQQSSLNLFPEWNGKEYDFFLTDTQRRWSAEESFLARVRKPDASLEPVASSFQFEWSSHFDSTSQFYLYSGRDPAHGSSAVSLHDLRDGTLRTLVPPDPNGGYFSLPRFHRDHVLYMRSNSLWRVDLAGSHPEQLFPAPGKVRSPPSLCRLQAGDTAGYKPALPERPSPPWRRVPACRAADFQSAQTNSSGQPLRGPRTTDPSDRPTFVLALRPEPSINLGPKGHRMQLRSLVLAMLLSGTNPPLVSSDLVRRVTSVPSAVREAWSLDAFYQKHVAAGPLPLVSSTNTSDYALLEAAYLVDRLLSGRPDLLDALATQRAKVVVMAHNEYTTDLPEQRHMRPQVYWDSRARGMGGRTCSCAEENLLCFPGDPYATENIFIHEFAHVIHGVALRQVDPTFAGRLESAYTNALARGLWKGTYAAGNAAEYWAEAVQDWFDNNRANDALHNHVHTRAQLLEYDPPLAALCREVFGDPPWRYQKPADRPAAERAHLAGYDFSAAPRFQWRRTPLPATPRAQIETAWGNLEVELYHDRAPTTVSNFLHYVEQRFYNDGAFFRTVTLVNQPTNTVKVQVLQAQANLARQPEFRPPIPLERTHDTGLKHLDGTLSMARLGPETAQTSFFICIGDQPELDFGGHRNPDGQGFAAFGRVVEGMDLVRRIHAGPTDGQQLTPPVPIQRAVRLE